MTLQDLRDQINEIEMELDVGTVLEDIPLQPDFIDNYDSVEIELMSYGERQYATIELNW